MQPCMSEFCMLLGRLRAIPEHLPLVCGTPPPLPPAQRPMHNRRSFAQTEFVWDTPSCLRSRVGCELVGLLSHASLDALHAGSSESGDLAGATSKHCAARSEGGALVQGVGGGLKRMGGFMHRGRYIGRVGMRVRSRKASGALATGLCIGVALESRRPGGYSLGSSD